MTVHSYLRKNGPSLTSQVIAAMQADGVSAGAARQRITRSQATYKRLAGLRFEKNARFLYLDDQYGSDEFWLALEEAFEASGKAYWGAAAGLRARGGACPKHMFPAVCGAPLARTGQLSPERVLERLTAIKFLREDRDEVTGESIIRFNPQSYPKIADARMRALLLAEYIALQAIREWARRLGFGSYGKFRLRGDSEPPIVSGITWDLTAPSYMRPLAKLQNGGIKPGFFVCDLNLNGPIGRDSVALFLRKHDMASAPPGVAPIFPFFIGEVFTQAAYDLARSNGIVATTVGDLFGADIAKALRNLIDLLSDAGATAAVNPEHLHTVMTSLSKIEGAADNLRGALFELVSGALAKDVEGGYLTTGQKVTDYQTGRAAEVDVLVMNKEKSELLIVECKSKIPGAAVSASEVQKWYTDRVPLIEKALRANPYYSEIKMRFELWSNGPFSSDALDWLKSQKLTVPGSIHGWKDGGALKDYARKSQSAAIRKILNEHYFNHPLAKAARNRQKPWDRLAIFAAMSYPLRIYAPNEKL